MRLFRREFLRLAGGALIGSATTSAIALARTYPSRPVRILVGFAAGGSNDTYARLIGQWLSDRLGQPFIVENRPGAGTNIATEAALKAPPDGYTLLLVNPANAINATLYERLNFNFIRDATPVAGMVRQPLVMLVNPSVPANTIPEFIAYTNTNPGKIAMASAGTGTAPHLAGELFRMMSNADLVHVPYRGAGPALIDLLSGQVHVYFAGMASSVEYLKTGKLRAFGTTAAARSDSLPGLATVGESVPGYEASDWFGLCAPKGTPEEIISQLNDEVNAALSDGKFTARIADLGGAVVQGSAADFGQLIADETARWAEVIRFARIKLD